MHDRLIVNRKIWETQVKTDVNDEAWDGYNELLNELKEKLEPLEITLTGVRVFEEYNWIRGARTKKEGKINEEKDKKPPVISLFGKFSSKCYFVFFQ